MVFPEEVVQALERALEEQGLTVIQETDLEAMQEYIDTLHMARLFVVIGEESADFDVGVGQHTSGDYLLPWSSHSILEELANGSTYLQDGEKKVYFSSARELFYGDTKAFIACTPSTT